MTPSTLFAWVTARAEALAAEPYAAPAEVSARLTSLDYDQYRSIRFRPEAALWRGDGLFEVQLFHPGSLFRIPVRLHLVEGQQLVDLAFDRTLFRYEGRAAPVADQVPPETGYAGFRIHYPLNTAHIKDEVAVFLGASYFRLLGPGQVHGLSSRGLAVDVALDRAEEFPAFREFWLVKPEPGESTMTFCALLDSPSVTGAYRFDLTPGPSTTVEVASQIYARQDVTKLGVAPMSSMFFYGQNRTPYVDDFRPQVHDSDGLLVQTSAGEWIWRPLHNPVGKRVSSLPDLRLRGFGLVQRDRGFTDYLDLETHYHRRPSEWVAVGDGDWGSGRVELLAYQTTSEFNDNIAAYWVPDAPFRAGESRRFEYQLVTFDRRLSEQHLAQVDRTRIGQDALPGDLDAPPSSHRRFIIDFSGEHPPLTDDAQPVTAVLEVSSGHATTPIVSALPGSAGWRASFGFAPDSERPSEMRLYLQHDDRRLSETWSYVWYPHRIN